MRGKTKLMVLKFYVQQKKGLVGGTDKHREGRKASRPHQPRT